MFSRAKKSAIETKSFKPTRTHYPPLATAWLTIYGRITSICSITETIICARNIFLDSSNTDGKKEVLVFVIVETIVGNIFIHSCTNKI